MHAGEWSCKDGILQQTPWRRVALGAFCATFAGMMLAGCAAQPLARRNPIDPWQGMNRAVWKFNDVIYRRVARPVGHAYTKVTPHILRTGVSNFLDNLLYPTVAVNDLLQGKPRGFAIDTGRFVLNTTLGLGGLLDPATRAGLVRRDNDFGRSLGTWAVRSGPYLVLPILGPSDVRDALGKIPDVFLTPIHYVNDNTIRYGYYGIDLLNTDVRTVIPAYEFLESQHPFDPYAFARNVYLQHRYYLIHGQSSEETPEKELEKLLKGTDSGDDAHPKPNAH
jgi:phospholipid-binding lipoprotein MlaA